MMQAQLLACLERLVTSLEGKSTLPALIDGDKQGVRYALPRADRICREYSSRHRKSEAELASMLLWTVAQFVLFEASTLQYLQVNAGPSRAQMQEVVDLLRAYTQGGGHIGIRESDPDHLCGPQYRKTLWGAAV